ncbi:hypothetical protein KC326_g106 [Hortaea werneckii]|nr:hypothetical protein KC326_g106 [Hortaea werneckii]
MIANWQVDDVINLMMGFCSKLSRRSTVDETQVAQQMVNIHTRPRQCNIVKQLLGPLLYEWRMKDETDIFMHRQRTAVAESLKDGCLAERSSFSPKPFENRPPPLP